MRSELAQITTAVETPIQLGENWWGPSDMGKEHRRRRVATRHVRCNEDRGASAAGCAPPAWQRQRVCLSRATSSPRFSEHLLASTPTCEWLEYLDKVGPILTEPVRVDNGRIIISERPGAGIEWDEHAIPLVEKV